MERRTHWNTVYETKGEQQVSWFEALPALSLQMMEAAGLNAETCVLDVGGGDSHLVDQLAARGLRCLAVLDVSEAALHRAQVRLGTNARIPTWIEADVAGEWSLKPMDIWHDRAVLHFLTDPVDRSRYVTRRSSQAVSPSSRPLRWTVRRCAVAYALSAIRPTRYGSCSKATSS